MKYVEANLVQVFVDENGQFGDCVTVVFDEEGTLSTSQRKELARRLCAEHGAVETVFVNDVPTRSLSIVHQRGELDFAGGPALGAAWLFSEIAGEQVDQMESRGGKIAVAHGDNTLWVKASMDAMPPWHHVQFDTAADIEAIKLADTRQWEHTMAWAWTTVEKGLIRARTFAPDWDIPEVQGNGSGSMMLAADLGREIEILHGDGSVIFARPNGQEHAELGGRAHQTGVDELALD